MSPIIRIAKDIAGNIGPKIVYAINCLLPSKQRERVLENLHTFSVRNPKLALFLAAQTALAGLPIFLFIICAITTLVVSLVTCVLLGIIAALVLTLLTTGFALVFVIPVVFIGSCTASIAFLWGFFGYLVLQRINRSETPVNLGTEVGNTLNELIDRRTCDPIDERNMRAQHERRAAASSQFEKILMGRESEREDNKTCGGSPHSRNYGQTNGICYGEETGEESDESGAQDAEIEMREYPEIRKSGYGPTAKREVEWGTGSPQNGFTT